MASSYPGALDTFATTHISGETIVATIDNDQADALNKIEAELGINPSGSQATVLARLAVIQDATDAYTATGHTADRAIASTTYTVTNVITDRSYDANSYTMDELADVLGTLIADVVELRNVVMTLVNDLKDRAIIG